jgi:hypothetical protein
MTATSCFPASPCTSTRFRLSSGGTLDDIRRLVENMRAKDWREISACLWHDERERFIHEFYHRLQCGSIYWIAWRGEVPVAIVGVMPCWPGVWSALMFATDDFPLIGKSLTRAIKKSIIPTLAEAGGFHRVSCNSIADYEEVHRWLRSLGAEEEAVIPRHGKNAENFVTFSFSDHVLRRQ